MPNQSMLQTRLDDMRVKHGFAPDNCYNVAIKLSRLEQTCRRTQWLLHLDRWLAADGLAHLCLVSTTTTTTTTTSTSTSTLYGGPCLNRGLSLMRLWVNTGRFFKWEKCWDFFFLYLNLRLLSGAQGFNVWFNTLCW